VTTSEFQLLYVPFLLPLFCLLLSTENERIRAVIRAVMKSCVDEQ